MSIDQSHTIAHEVQHRLREFRSDIQDVTIHVEPDGSLFTQSSQEGIAALLRRLAAGLGAAVHDIWAHEVAGRYFVEAHVEVDGTLPLSQAHQVASSLEEQARAEMPHLDEVVTHIEPKGALVAAPHSDVEEGQVLQSVQQTIASGELAGSCHDIQVRRSGGGGWVVSLHCLLPGEMPLVEAHRKSTRLETRLRGEVPRLERVVIHTEPRHP